MNVDLSAASRKEAAPPASFTDPTATKARDGRGVWCLIVVGIVAVILCLPFIRMVHCLCSDEGVFLRGAELMLAGSRLYVDFFEFLPPGSFVITAAWFGITGISMFSARLLAILTLAGIACFTYLACRQASKDPTLSVLLALGWLVMSQGPWTQVSHHWFTTLFSMIVVWVTLASFEYSQRWPWGPLVGGVAAGAAFMVTPTRGALVILAAASAFVGLRRYKAELVAFVLGSALIPVCLLAYVIGYGGLTEAFDDVILFPATRYAHVNGAPYAYATNWQNFPFKYLFPVAALLTIVIGVRSWRSCFHDRLSRSCAAFGLAGGIGFLPRPDIYHIAFAAPVALPLLALCASRVMRPWLPKYRSTVAAFVISFCAPSIIALLLFAHIAVSGEIVAMPRGKVTILRDGEAARKLAAWIAATPLEDDYFFYPYMALAPFLTDRRHVSRYDIFIPDYTLPSQYQEACFSAMRRASWVVIDALKRGYPTMPHTVPREAKRFEEALERGFELAARKGPFEIRRRVKSVDESVCADIAE